MIAAAIIYRWPWLYLLAVVATAPARVPFHVGKTDANLLVPLYVVIAAGAAATAYELLREREPARGTGWIGMALVAFVGWSAISMAWSVDSHHGAIEMLFFYLPFGLMVARLAQLRIDPSALRAALTVQAVLAVVFATVALGQELTHHIFWNPGIEVENTYKSFFRVNSLFWDASIYARFMAVTLVLLAGVAIHRRASPWLLALMTYLFLGMYVSYSPVRVPGAGGGHARAGREPVAATRHDRDRRHRRSGGPGRVADRPQRLKREQSHVRPAAPVAARKACDQRPPADRRRTGRILEGGAGGVEAPMAGCKRRVAHDAADGDRGAGAGGNRAVLAMIAAVVVAAVGSGPYRAARLTLLAAFLAILTKLDLLQCVLRRPDDLDLDGATRAHIHLARHRGLAGATRVISAGRRALVLAPHTDDGEFGCGGTIARLVEAGAEVHYAAFSTASRSLPEGFPADTLAHEVRAATGALGIPESNPPSTTSRCGRPAARQEILEILVSINAI